jgi:hypothetical protein
MNIYEGEGVDAIVDLRAATAELKGSASVTNDTVKRQIVAEIQTAALLDIALSLRVVAAEARAAMPEFVAEYVAEYAEPERDFLVEGDLVAVDGYDDPAEVVKLGVSEGTVWAEVVFASGADARVWGSTVHRLIGDERDDAAMREAAEKSVVAVNAELARLNAAADAEGEIEPADLVDDIDADFDGGQHPAAATALDMLKANEAERKAAKKAGKKGSKK